MKLAYDAIGLSVKSYYANEILSMRPQIDFLEAHIENYFDGGAALKTLCELAQYYPISLHGVALSLGGFTPPKQYDLKQRKRIIDLIQPVLSLNMHLVHRGNSISMSFCPSH